MAVREFLLKLHQTGQPLAAWEPRRWEGLVFYNDDVGVVTTRARLSAEVAIARRDGEICGVATPEYPGGVWLNCHPDDTEVFDCLLEWAEAHLPVAVEQGRKLEVWCRDSQLAKKARLEARGYQPTGDHQIGRQLELTHDIPLPPLASGYRLEHIRPELAQSLADLLNAAFGRTSHNASEYLNFAALAPSYDATLELAVIAPNGEIAAQVGFTAHPEQGFAIIEPVATHPAHQNLGLARHAMIAGLNECRRRRIRFTYVEAWYANPVSNHVYASVGFDNPAFDRKWVKLCPESQPS